MLRTQGTVTLDAGIYSVGAWHSLLHLVCAEVSLWDYLLMCTIQYNIILIRKLSGLNFNRWNVIAGNMYMYNRYVMILLFFVLFKVRVQIQFVEMWKSNRWHFTISTAITYSCRPIADGRDASRLSAKASVSAVGQFHQTPAFMCGLPRSQQAGVEQSDSVLCCTILPRWIEKLYRVMLVQIWRIVLDTGPKRCPSV